MKVINYNNLMQTGRDYLPMVISVIQPIIELTRTIYSKTPITNINHGNRRVLFL